MVEVMTDKATVQIPSPTTGKVGRIMSKEGQVVKVGDVLVTFEEDGGSTGQVQMANLSQASPSSAIQQKVEPMRNSGIGVVATPATRKLARDLNVNIESISGSGPGGRIIEDDIRKAAQPLRAEGSFFRAPFSPTNGPTAPNSTRQSPIGFDKPSPLCCIAITKRGTRADSRNQKANRREDVKIGPYCRSCNSRGRS